MIPKIIHCCWFGGPKTKLAERCMASWGKFAPGWEIREWNRDSVAPLSPPPFAAEALAGGKWAFAADWLRFAALFAHGGVYLDCDVELVAPLAPGGEFIAGQWMPDGAVGLEPAVMALERGSPVAEHMVEHFRSAPFDCSRTAGERLSGVLRESRLMLEVLAPEVFCPIDVDGSMRQTERTVGIHRCAMSWCPLRRRVARWMSWHGLHPVVDFILKTRGRR